MNDQNPLYPLTFRPIYKEKVWGGRSLEKLGRRLPGDGLAGIGESWELADLSTTSATGGGGAAEHSVVADGPLKGKTIRELIQTYGEDLLGKGVAPSDDGGFPLLIKFLDAKENLSVQVHPSPAYAAANPDAHLKSEAWYIVDAQPGAVIYKGLAPGTTPEMLRAAIEANTDAAVVPLLNAVPVRKGDCHYLPSGTLHALGAGVMVAEVQTPSDTTYRVYDWGRTDRELHVEQAMACIDFSDQCENEDDCAVAVPWSDGLMMKVVSACEFFAILEFVCDSDTEIQSENPEERSLGNHPAILMPLAGSARITYTDGSTADLQPGNTLLIPAALVSIRSIHADAGARWLKINPGDAAR